MGDLVTKAGGAVGDDFGFPVGAGGALGVWVGSRDATEVVLEDGAGMLVGRDGCAEADVAEVLQGVGEFVVGGVVAFPVAVALGELLGAKGGESEKVVGAVFNHVDAEVVAGVDLEVGAHFVANAEAFQFFESAEGGVLDAFERGNGEKAADGCLVVDHAVGCEHFSEFEADYGIEGLANFGVEVGDLLGTPIVKAGGLKENRGAAV